MAALNRRIQLLEEDLERSEERLATATQEQNPLNSFPASFNTFFKNVVRYNFPVAAAFLYLYEKADNFWLNFNVWKHFMFIAFLVGVA